MPPPRLHFRAATLRDLARVRSHPLARRLGWWTRRSLRNLCALLALLVSARLACEAAWWAAVTSRHLPPGGPGARATLAAWGRGHAAAVWRGCGGGGGGGGRGRAAAPDFGVGVGPSARSHSTAWLGRVVPAGVEEWAELVRGYEHWPPRRRYRVTTDLRLVPVKEETVTVIVFDQVIGSWREEKENRGLRDTGARERTVVELDQQWWSWEDIDKAEDPGDTEQAEDVEQSQEARQSRRRESLKQCELERKQEREKLYREIRGTRKTRMAKDAGEGGWELEDELLRNREEVEEEWDILVRKWEESRPDSNIV